MYINFLHTSNKPNYFVSSAFVTNLMGKDLQSYCPYKVNTWSYRAPFYNFFVKYRRIYFSVNYRCAHWTLLVADFENREILYFDPLGHSKNTPYSNHSCYKLLLYMEYLANQLKYHAFFSSRWNVIVYNKSKFVYPKQEDACNCGLYTIITADILSLYYPTVKQSKVFYLSRYVNHQIINQRNCCQTLIALILMFNKNHFDCNVESNSNKALIKGQSPPSCVAFRNNKLKSLNLSHPNSNKNSELYVIDRDDNSKERPNSVSVFRYCDNDEYETTSHKYCKLNIHSKVMYLLIHCSSFQNNFVYYHLHNNSTSFVKAKENAYEKAMKKTKEECIKESTGNNGSILSSGSYYSDQDIKEAQEIYADTA